MLIALTTCVGRGERGSLEKEGARAKQASYYYKGTNHLIFTGGGGGVPVLR